MELITVKNVQAADRLDVVMKTIFADDGVTMGYASFPPGARVPAQGSGSHEQDEYSYVLKGSVVTEAGGKEYRMTAGQASLIPTGEAHWAQNDGQEDCELIWILVKR